MFGSIVEGNYHPLVRYNALLAIGKLDEITGKQNIAVPKPYRDSLKYLIEKYNGFTGPKLHYLKYGAFKGIARIAAIGFQSPNTTNADAAKPIFAALLGAKPADLNEDLFRSMQRSAVEVLGLLGDPANGDALAAVAPADAAQEVIDMVEELHETLRALEKKAAAGRERTKGGREEQGRRR